MSDQKIDLAAASRISRRVDLKEIRLTEIRATCEPHVSGSQPLQPTYDHNSMLMPAAVDGHIEVACSYSFKVRSAEIDLAEATMTYWITYKLLGDEPAELSDIEQFARVNGAYHSWPFVRETIFSLTGRMGFPPFTLPVLSFLPRQPTPPLTAEGTDQKESKKRKRSSA